MREDSPLVQPYQSKSSLLKNRAQPLFPFSILAILCCIWEFLANELDVVMQTGFLVGVPVITGALISFIYNHTNSGTFKHIFATTFIFLIFLLSFATALFHQYILEFILTTPVLWVGMFASATITHAFCRLYWKPHAIFYFIAFIPFGSILLPEYFYTQHDTVEKSLIIEATPAIIWQQIIHIPEIRTHELKNTFVDYIGMSSPVSGTLYYSPEGIVQYSMWKKSIRFEEVTQHAKHQQYIRWTYHFEPSSLVSNTLDEYMLLDERFFDIKYTAFELTPITASKTKLTFKTEYRISTEKNPHANAVAQVMINQLSDTLLNFYRNKSENV